MKKVKVGLRALSLKKETIAPLSAEKVTGGIPPTLIDRSCFQTCQATCTLDGTIASKYVSNCCPIG